MLLFVTLRGALGNTPINHTVQNCQGQMVQKGKSISFDQPIYKRKKV